MYKDLLNEIDNLGTTKKYQPLNKELKEKYHKLYNENLNGFENRRNLNIDGKPFARSYTRVVIGDYGAYVEIESDALLVELTIPEKQKWRLDKDFLSKRNLNIKYEWYEYNNKKVYFQLNAVTYADYKPDYYYISVLYFDILKEDNMLLKDNYSWLSNMDLFPKPIIINNEIIKSSENYYQSRKTLDLDIRKKILAMSPYEAKKYCKTIELRNDWEDVKVSIMQEALDIKFSITYYRLLLIGTVEPIVEDNYWNDTYWGVCRGIGENMLGKLLTTLRERIIKEEEFKKKIRYGDLYKSDMEYKCFTANSTLNKNNELIMGKGNALTVKEMYPELPKVFGNKIKDKSLFGISLDVNTNIIAFQTKIDWKENSTVDIIKNSISKLNDFAVSFYPCPIGIPFPGINNGKLNENLVIQYLLELKHSNTYIWKSKPDKFFTGIGSRETPKWAGELLSKFTNYMTSRGYVLRSGGAPGADTYCESGVTNTLIKDSNDFKEIYIPWKGFNGSDSNLYTLEDSEEVIAIAENNHPAYKYLKPQVKKLMNRNVYQVLGKDLNTPSEFVICYTNDGCKSHTTRTNKTGGTGLAISVASNNNVPIINLGNTDDLNRILNILGLEIALIDFDKILGDEDTMFKLLYNKSLFSSFKDYFENKEVPVEVKYFIDNNIPNKVYETLYGVLELSNEYKLKVIRKKER